MALENVTKLDFGPHVNINKGENTLTIKFQKGPIKEVGENGAQIDVLSDITYEVLRSLNEVFPCEENERAMQGCIETKLWLDARRQNRNRRGVEGLSKE